MRKHRQERTREGRGSPTRETEPRAICQLEQPTKLQLLKIVQSGSTISNVLSSLLFLPIRYPEVTGATDLELAVSSSNREDQLQPQQVEIGEGPIGWVAEQNRPRLYSDPDPRDYRLYPSLLIKSIVAFPVLLSGAHTARGVIAFDSLKSHAFGKRHLVTLRDLALEIAETLNTNVRAQLALRPSSWESFLKRGERLLEALGGDGVEMIRVHITNDAETSSRLGRELWEESKERFLRLVEQTLPPHFPICRLHDGDIAILVDNLMSSFFKKKIEAVAAKTPEPGHCFKIRFVCKDGRSFGMGSIDLEQLLHETELPVGEPLIA